ncbi:leucine-rich repeat-containing protein 56 [Stegastes partitus]|uniref:Leucine-rich repeat-containing protein 56 n=1 Tax=Stegastes partitus TaxID=144197 RepID=A0A9Y4MY63_9TELE|nr:PREDICTED: leucine-rich repeat-containing protein 56 [Stegastes partitus]
MSGCHGSVPQEQRPGTARVLVTELSGSGHINPTPSTKTCRDSETAVELYLSPDGLKSLCGTQDLSHVTSLEVCVDTQENTLGNFGAYLPRLVRLKMNNSIIMSVRDLGTTLSHLQVLWMSRCCLQCLDGISTLCSLKELYLAYNYVSELSPIGMLENLQLLDLEGNDVDDLVQVQYLGLCPKLQILTLEGNPVCLHPNPTSTQMADYSYQTAVRELVPQLRYLDGERVEEDKPSCHTTKGEELEILINSIRDCNSSLAAGMDEETADSACPYSRPSSARRPSSSLSCIWPMSSAASRPHTRSRPMSATRPAVLSPPGSRPGSADSDLAAVEAETSALTHGAGKILFCGNPVQAIRARREKLKTAPTKSTVTPRDLPIHVPEHTYDLEEPDLRERVNVFAELRAWREQHRSRLQAIERERLPQILAIHHDDDDEEEEEEADDDEEEGFSGMRSDSSVEEPEEEKHCDSRDAASPDSSFESLSPDLYHREALSPDMARLSLSPDTPLFPSPPLSATAASGNRTISQIRARRLRLSQANSENAPDFSRVACKPGTGTAAADTDLILQRVQQMTRTKAPVLPQSAPTPHPPPASALGEGLMDSCVEMNQPSAQLRPHKYKMSKILNRPVITRPHTARAALQKHHQHHILQPSRGSSQPD